MVYLDYAAATPLDSDVADAMRPFEQERFYNPSSIYLAARDVKLALREARAGIAHWLGCQPGEVIFTAGATEANNLALQGVLNQDPSYLALFSAAEHVAVTAAVDAERQRSIPINKQGRTDLIQLEKLIDDQVAVVSVHYVNNEFGTLQPLAEISRIIEQVRKQRHKRGVKTPLYFHTDAAQAAQYFDLHVSRLGVDLMTLSAAKLYGPKQVGALYVKSGLKLKPLISGGGQERGLRSGTENVAGAIGLAAALTKAQTMRRTEAERVVQLRDRLLDRLESLAGVRIIVGRKHRSPNNIAFLVEDADGERLVMELDEAGFQVGTGAACSARSDEPSPALLALGLTPDEANGSLRVTLGRGTTAEHIDSFVEALGRVLS